jgi:orotidine-5'-phosphate decarboxylase
VTGSNHLAVALDVADAPRAIALADQLRGAALVFKVGLELFTSEGPPVAREIAKRGRLFLDLKLHDIPHTVEGAARAASRLGASYLTVHASGGHAMVEAAVRGAGPDLKILAVTLLTSLGRSELDDIGFEGGAHAAVLRLARLGVAAGAHGLVCSSAETAELRRELGPDPVLVVPGIRPKGSEARDQKRVGTPKDAIRAGASLLVVGRPILEASNPRQAADAIAKEVEEAAEENGR